MVRAFLTDVFQLWRGNSFPFLVLRNYETLPEIVTGDVDLLVPPGLLAQAESDLISCASAHGLCLVNRVWFSPLALFFANPATGEQIHIDLFQHLLWRGIPLLDPDAALARRRDYRSSFFIPHPTDEAAINLLTRLLYRGKVKDAYRESIKAAFEADPVGAKMALESVFGNQAYSVFSKVRCDKWNEIEESACALRVAAVRSRLKHPWIWASALGRDAVRLAMRYIRTPGVLVVMLGPDGAGKSTVAAGLQQRLASTFSAEKCLAIHWKPKSGDQRRAARTVVSDPHGKRPRSLAASLGFLAYHWVGFIAGGWLVVRPALFRNGMVLIDRYFHDMQADPLRYRLDPRTPGIPFLQKFLPVPDLIFVLDAPAEVFQARKSEVSAEETARQRSAYAAIALSTAHAYMLDAAQPADAVVRQASVLVLEHLIRRQQRRDGGNSGK